MFKSCSLKYEKALRPFSFLKNKDTATPYEAFLTNLLCNARFIYLKRKRQDPAQHLLFWYGQYKVAIFCFMADQWSAQAVHEHFLNYFSMASVPILTDDCITQEWSTQTLPSSVYWLSRKQAPTELTSHKDQRRRTPLFSSSVYQTSVSFAQTRQPVGLQEKLKWSCTL